MADPDLQIRGVGRGVPGHPNPDIMGGGGLQKIFLPFGPQFGLKIRGEGPPDPSPGFATVNSSVTSSRVNCSVYLDFLKPALFGYLRQERVRNHRHIAA